jgi:hypothetical protein
MPTTKRLLTDETGQALVTAVNNIVAAVKPNATEIQMSSSDTTTVATAITNINDKIGTVPSGQTVEGQITTLNDKSSTYVIASNTLANVESALIIFGDTLDENEIRKIRFNISTASGVFANQGYMGTIKRYGSGPRYIVEVQDCNAYGRGYVITGTYYNNAWSWDSLNSNMATLQYTGTVDSLQTSLVSLASNMSVGDFHNIKYTAGETLSPFRNTCIYGGTFKRTGSNYWSVTLEDPEGVPIYGTYRNGTWRWEPLALESDITPVSTTASSEHTYQNRAIQFRKHAGCVTVRIEGLMNIPQSQSITMCTMPSGYEPIGEITDDRVVATGGAVVKVRVSIGANVIAVYNYGAAINDGNVIMTLTYACQ